MVRLTCHRSPELDLYPTFPRRDYVVGRESFYVSHAQLFELRRVRHCYGMYAASRSTAAALPAQYLRFRHTQLY